MIFLEKLNVLSEAITPSFDNLFNAVIETQSHYGDLLLIAENGLYNPDVHNWDNLDTKYSPYTIGPALEGHSANTHYDFIQNYILNSTSKISYNDYLKKLEYSEEKREQIQRMQKEEAFLIQQEMLIYLKIWESDIFIKKFYQIVQLLQGQPYDWHFKISQSNRDKGATGNRQTILRKKIRDKFQNDFPLIYNAFKVSYNTQIRNSIAHSKYLIIGRSIGLNNYIAEDKAFQLHAIEFDDWINKFNNTLIIYFELIKFTNKIQSYYRTIAKENNGIVEVKINRKDPTDKVEYNFLKYSGNEAFDRWSWLNN